MYRAQWQRSCGTSPNITVWMYCNCYSSSSLVKKTYLLGIYGHIFIYRFKYLQVFWWLTLGRFGACADAIFRVVNLFSLHHNVLETFVISVEAMLQQLTESHRAAAQIKINKGAKGLRYVTIKQLKVCEKVFFIIFPPYAKFCFMAILKTETINVSGILNPISLTPSHPAAELQ